MRPPARRTARRRGDRPARVAVAGAGAALLAALAGGVAWAQEGPADPAATREQVRRVMSAPRYSYRPTLLERIGEWIADQLRRLTPDTGPGGTFGGGVGAWVAWAVIVVAVVVAVVVGVLVFRGRTRRARTEEGPATTEEVEHRRRAADWARDARRFEAAGEWKEALRAHYRVLVRTLVDRRQLADVPGRTTGELRVDLAATTPDAGEPFDTACLLFELAWYADVPTGEEQVRSLEQAAAQVLAAPVRDRWDGDRLVAAVRPPAGAAAGGGRP